jgi:hypothetical protein
MDCLVLPPILYRDIVASVKVEAQTLRKLLVFNMPAWRNWQTR